MKNHRILIPAVLALAMASPAFASEITCSLTTGSSTAGCTQVTTSSTSTLSGTVVAPSSTSTLSGTVVAPSNSGGGSSSSGGGGSSSSGGGGGGSSSSGGGGGGGGSVLGASTGTPSVVGVPNTGAGGNAPSTIVTLVLAALVAVGSGLYLRKQKLG